MMLCFLYGGFSLILFLFGAYTLFWQTEIVGAPSFDNVANDFNHFSERGYSRFDGGGRFSLNPIALLTSPITLSYLIGGIVAILAGIAIWNLIREKEIKSVKQQTANNLLLPDEKAIINALKKSNYELTQAKLAKETGLNKVQVHRVIKRLESKGVLEKHEYGLTNKIILKKEFFE